MYVSTTTVFKSLLKTVLESNVSLRKVFFSSNNDQTLVANILKAKMDLPKRRDNPVIMKLDTPEFEAIFTPEVNTLVALFNRYGYEIRAAGGPVRDLLMGKVPKDLDFATTATPDEMKTMFTNESIRMINMKGEKHGTITPRVNDKENFEVTTLRIDVVTDGRHAEVQFTTDWMLDASRRDLTINSMFLDMHGTVYDYFYGHEDLLKRRIAFVGSPEKRIQEDYLRILRYFRFYGRYAKEPNKHEDKIVAAIAANANGLRQISGERIWSELKKILEGNYAGELMEKMIECGLSKHMGLPEKINLSQFRNVWSKSKRLNMQAITLMSAFLNTLDDAAALHARLKLSAYERDLIIFIVEHRDDKPHSKPLLPYQQLLLKSKSKLSDTREWIIEVLKYRNSDLLAEFEDWVVPKFPVNGNMLKDFGVTGKIIGVILNELRGYWADHDFVPSVDELLNKVPDILSTLNDKKREKNKN